MSLTRGLVVVAVAVVFALVVLIWLPRDRNAQDDDGGAAVAARGASSGAGVGRAGAGAGGGSSSLSALASGQMAARSRVLPELPDGAPFRAQDLAITTDMQEGAVVALRSSSRAGRDLTVELGIREPLPEGKRVFANLSVSDALGNSILDCTWRDVELTSEARTVECELPLGVELPLSISGHQLPAPSFVESPSVVAIDKAARL
jgi:hypothetical protein